MTILLPDDFYFPDVAQANPEGLLAAGGDLSIPRLLLAYRSGIFPWTDRPITWWSPHPRAIFELDRIRPSRRLAKKLKQNPFRITFNQNFIEVIRQCASQSRERSSTWISRRFIHAYHKLHQKGYAHSVEAWQGDQLVGGVYGVHIGSFFAGESMFYRVTDASKICLFHLFDRLHERGFSLFDTQVLSPLTQQLGAIEISRTDYLQRLGKALEKKAVF